MYLCIYVCMYAYMHMYTYMCGRGGTDSARLKLSGKSAMRLRIPPLRIKIMLESNPLKSTMSVGGLGVSGFERSTVGFRQLSQLAAVCARHPSNQSPERIRTGNNSPVISCAYL